MPLSGTSSIQDAGDVFFGEWPRIYGIVDPLGAATEVYLGAVYDGSLKTLREDFKLNGTTFPAVLEISVPISVDMQFTGTAVELKFGLLHYLVGDECIDDTSHYINPGAACAFNDIDLSLFGERINCDGNMLIFKMHRARASGAIEIGSNASGNIGTPMELNALNDSVGAFGGSVSSPLGWIWLSSNDAMRA